MTHRMNWMAGLYRVFTGRKLVYTRNSAKMLALVAEANDTRGQAFANLDMALAGDDVHLVHRLQWLGWRDEKERAGAGAPSSSAGQGDSR